MEVQLFAQLNFDKTGKTCCKSKVNKILRNKMNYKYLKTTRKNIKLISCESIRMNHLLNSIITCLLSNNYDIIFVDGSKIQTQSNNFKCWRMKSDAIYCKFDNQKRNLIAAMNNKRVIYYEINKDNTDSIKYANFIANFNSERIKL